MFYSSSSPGTCDVGEWSEWSDCSVNCGEGLQTRSRSILSHTEGTPCPVVEDEKYCVRESCAVPEGSCRLEEWNEWGECNPECGKGGANCVLFINFSFLGWFCKNLSDLFEKE